MTRLFKVGDMVSFGIKANGLPNWDYDFCEGSTNKIATGVVVRADEEEFKVAFTHPDYGQECWMWPQPTSDKFQHDEDTYIKHFTEAESKARTEEDKFQCKWNGKTICGPIPVDLHQLKAGILSQKASAIEVQRIGEAEQKIRRHISANFREWPTCPFGNVNIELITEQKDKSWTVQGKWECSCGK